MPSEDIDDLFRSQLDGHATPPGEDLWARLQAHPPASAAPDPAAERLDRLFQQKLNAHATPPRRELWERLEDEHLRPIQRRAAAWWPLALAAAVALLLVAGGAGLWLGFPVKNTPVATGITNGQPKAVNPVGANKPDGAANNASRVSAQPEQAAADNTGTATPRQKPALAAAAPGPPAKYAAETASEKNLTLRATRFQALASTAPKARTFASGRSPRHLRESPRRPDADAGRLPLVARSATRPRRPTAADEPRQAAETTPAVAVAPNPAPAPEIVPAPAASPANVITVDVRTSGAPAMRPAKTVSSALAELAEPEERRRLGGRLLQQAGHLVRGERVSLAEVTGLPENVTVRATVAGRSLTKSIQL